MTTFPTNRDPTSLALVTIASASIMGQQVYEGEITRNASAAAGPTWDVRHLAVRTLRSGLPGDLRLPSRLLNKGSRMTRLVAGSMIYRGIDLVHRLDLRIPPAPGRDIVTVHDLAPWRYDDEGTVPSDSASTCARARAIVCPSEFSAGEIADRFCVATPHVVPYGVDEMFLGARPLDPLELAALGLRVPYVLHAGGSSKRKNLTALAEAWPLVKSVHPGAVLALAGPPDGRRDALFGPLAGAFRLGRVPRETLVSLIAGASAVVVPSLYEGFGLPVLEAMAAGAPVVAARCSSLPEVCGDAGVLVDPTGRGLADGIVSVLDGGAEVQDLVARGRRRAARFTWQASAAGHVRVWESVRG